MTRSLDELYTLAAGNDTAVLRNQRMVERGRWESPWRKRNTGRTSASATCISSGRDCQI